MTGSGENRPRLNSEKARRAAQHPDRPGEKCGADPDFLYAAPDTTACAAFIKESRMNIANANQLHRKSGEAGASRGPCAVVRCHSHHSLISSLVDQKAILAVDLNRLDLVE